MAITKTLIQNSASRAVVKLTATAASDTATITLKSSALTIGTTGNITFSASTRTITRASGSWITAGFVPGTMVTFSGTTSNNKSFSVLAVTALTITIDRNVINEVAAAATVTAYNSDIVFPGQTFSTPAVNITNVKYSLGGSCSVVRNAITVLNLYGTWMANNDGFGLSEQNDQNIVVTFTTQGGTLLIELAKVGGFDLESQAFNAGA